MREIRTTLLPNGEQQVQAGGDFVYIDFVDREIKLMIHDQIITVNAGDKVRPQRSFKSLTVINPDDSNPVAVVLKVGEGDYSSQIIRGEVSVTPGVRRADGVFIEDTRRDMTGIIWPVDMGKNVKQGETLYQTAQNLPETGDEDWFSFDESLQQFLVLSKGDSLGDNATAQYYDLKLNPVSSFPVLYKITNIPNNSPDGQDWGVFNSQPSDIVAYKGAHNKTCQHARDFSVRAHKRHG